MTKRKKDVKVMPFFKYLAFTMVIITIITLVLFKFIDVLPNEYYITLCILLSIFTIILSSLVLTKRGPGKRIFGTILSLIYIILVIMAIIYELNTIGFLKKLGFQNYKTENYSVITLKDAKVNSLEELNQKKIGCLDFKSDGFSIAKNKLEKKGNFQINSFDDIGKLKKNFIKKEIDAMLIENAILAILTEDDDEFASSYKVVDEFSIDIEMKDITKDVDITKDTFSIYVSGIDTYGVVSSVSRSDVNMIVTVNPNTHEVLITSIPRDYYVPLYGKNGKDKLTHAGIYGVEVSVHTIEKLLNIKINYYVKVNFTSVIKLVDTLGGVDVYSDYSFTSIDGYTYKEGYNTLKGEKALSFVRERKAFNGGDRVRAMNQAAMVKALIDKVTNPSIIVKYNSILNTLDNSFVTNLDMDDITKFIKKQIDDGIPSWNVLNQLLDGTDDYQYTYSYSAGKLYVMRPNQETVINAYEKIKEMY